MAHIRIDDIKPRKRYAVGSTPTSVFAIPFAFFETGDIKVFVGGSRITSGYTVTGNTGREGGYEGGSVTLTTPVTNTTVAVVRDVTARRTTDFPAAGGLRIPALNTELDRLTAVLQQLIDRVIQVPADDTDGAMTLPTRASRAGKLLAFGSDGTPTPTEVTMQQLAATVVAAFSAGKVLVEVPPVVSDGVLTEIETDFDLISDVQVLLTVGGIFQPAGSGAYSVSGTKIILAEPAAAGLLIHPRIIGASNDVQGPRGLQGISVTAGTVNGSGHLILTMSDASTIDVGAVVGPQGPAGADGADGAPGANGADGRTVLNGSGAPASGAGANGDFYIDTGSWTLYGPKTAGAWGSGVSLVGPACSTAWADITGKPTTVAAAGLTDAATKAYAESAAAAAVAGLVGTAPAALDTIQELATALGNDPNAITSIITALAGKAAKGQWVTLALSDEGAALTTGTAKVTWRAPHAMTLTAIPRASVNTASSSGLVTVDVKVGGTSVLGTNKLSIDASEKSSTTAATPTTLTTTAVADDAEFTFDVTAAGTGAKGLKLTLYYEAA